MDGGKRLQRIADAERSEFGRIIERNQELHADLRLLRMRWGLPLTDGNTAARWLDHLGAEERTRFDAEVRKAIQSHGIPAKWESVIYGMVYVGDADKIPIPLPCGMPAVHLRYEADRIIHDFTGGSETDYSNPVVKNFIRNTNVSLARFDPPPRPIERGRALDWEPVFEWSVKHPDVTIAEIAAMLGYNASYLRRKLSEFV